MSVKDRTNPTLEAAEFTLEVDTTHDAVATAVQQGLSARPKWLPAWLFYDAEGSRLFEQITTLPEYYPTRTERAIFSSHADEIIDAALAIAAHEYADAPAGKLRFLELGAGSASKTGILLAAAVQRQGTTEYLPIDVSETAMEEARISIARALSGVEVHPQVANYVTDALDVPPHVGPTVALYIGSSIGNFAPGEACAILQNLRAQMRPGDSLLLGTDLVKDLQPLLAAYNDQQGITAAFNRNMLRRLNRDLYAGFDLNKFHHEAIWNANLSRIEMHLRSTVAQTVPVRLLGSSISFAAGETIHTENSYKFTAASIASLLKTSGFVVCTTWHDARNWFAVTLAARSS